MNDWIGMVQMFIIKTELIVWGIQYTVHRTVCKELTSGLLANTRLGIL